MTLPISLAMSGNQHRALQAHLFPGDNLEAVAFLLCGRCVGDRRVRLLVREVHPIPYDQCSRSTVTVTWDTEALATLLTRAESLGLSVIKVHGHPNGYPLFSETDDRADNKLLPMIRGWVERDIPHGSAVMLPSGEMFGRVLAAGQTVPIVSIGVVGDDIRFWDIGDHGTAIPEFTASHAQAFDEGTIRLLRGRSVAIIGASGTGSPTVEQLARLGVGEIVLVDDDVVEDRNVNRILNSTMADVTTKRTKTDVLADAVERMGLGTHVIRISKSLWCPEAVRAVAQCDVVFGCMDTVDGRYLLNLLATFYMQAYFDIGVRLDAVKKANGQSDIREICGTVNYLQPGKSSLVTRGLFTIEQVAAAGLRRADPDAHRQQIKDGYIKGVQARRPAVISVNMFASSLAVNEFLARLHPYREEHNAAYSAVTFSLASMELIHDAETTICPMIARFVGHGDVVPLLNLPELSERAT